MALAGTLTTSQAQPEANLRSACEAYYTLVS